MYLKSTSNQKFQLSSVFRALIGFPRVPWYTYKQLSTPSDSTRLVLLQPALHLNSPIHCRIIETSSTRESESLRLKGFTALSYTWGDLSPKVEIKIDGRPFGITRNLEWALRYLRLQRKELRLWVDGIFINQNDTEEKNRHVRQMRSIYAAATETTIFLGGATEGSDVLMQAMIDAKTEVYFAKLKSNVVNALMESSALSKRDLREKGFEILWRRYWRRIWVFQEIVVSDDPYVQCGQIKVPWETFCQSLIALLDSDVEMWGAGYDIEPKRRLEDIYWERRAYRHSQGLMEKLPGWDMARGYDFKGRTRLLDLLTTKRGSEASDARDMVFAISGVAKMPDNRNPVSITYEKSVSLVYTNVASYLIKHDSSYEVLSHAGQFQNQLSRTEHNDIPSWAPDWRSPSNYKDKIADLVEFSSNEKVGKSHVFLEEHGVLVCPGCIFDRIHLIRESEEIDRHNSSIGRVSWNKWRRRKFFENGIHPHLGTELGTVASLFAMMHPLTYRRKIAQTKKGTLCLVPKDTRVGDLICQFDGSPIPYILRPLDENQAKGKDNEISSSLVRGIIKLISQSRTREFALDQLDTIIENALEEKGISNASIQHCTLIGESFIDGLMSRSAVEGRVLKRQMAFALH